MKKLFRAGFFGGLGVFTAFVLMWLLIWLVIGFVNQLMYVNSLSPTPEAALQKSIFTNRDMQYEVLSKRKLSNGSIIFFLLQPGQERKYVKYYKCLVVKPVWWRGCALEKCGIGN